MDIHEYEKQRCRGYMSSWVALEKQPLKTVAKTIGTIARRHSISTSELSAIVDQVRSLSVDPFGSERRDRYRQLIEALHAERVV